MFWPPDEFVWPSSPEGNTCLFSAKSFTIGVFNLKLEVGILEVLVENFN